MADMYQGPDGEEANNMYKEESEAAQPAMAGERRWQAKMAEDNRQRNRKQRKQREPEQDKPPKPPPKRAKAPKRKKKPKVRRKNAALARWLYAAVQIVPYAALLLLAPLIRRPLEFYILALLLAAPAAIAAVVLRPLGPNAWVLRAAAPLLPVEAWFALQYFSWNPVPTLALLGLCVLAGVLCYLITMRGKKKAGEDEEDTPEQEPEGGQEPKPAEPDPKERVRRFLLRVVPLACALLLLPALLGLRLQLYWPKPSVPDAFEQESIEKDEVMARRMNAVYGNLQADVWVQADRSERLANLQALLNTETDRMEIDRFDLRDPAVLATVQGKGHFGISAALMSGSGKTEERVRAMCHLAFHLKQLTISEQVNMRGFEDEAKGYEDFQYQTYVNLWNNREMETDDAG